MLCSENVQFACGFVVKRISFLKEMQTADGLNFFLVIGAPAMGHIRIFGIGLELACN